MKVLHIYSGNLFGGVETFLVTLAKCQDLCPDMHHSFALCFEGRLSRELRTETKNVFILGKVRISRPWYVWLARKKLSELLRQDKFSLVVCHGCWAQFVFGSVVKKLNIPLILWLHDIIKGTHWLEVLARRVVPDFILANSKYTQKTVANLFPKIPNESVYYPVITPDTKDYEVIRRKKRDELGIPKGSVVIALIARLEKWKGHELLISSLARIKDLADWSCCIVGGPQRPKESKYLKSLKQKVLRLGIKDRIRFLGECRDTFPILLASDIFCQPNITPEPFGISLIEAMYAKMPIVTTDIKSGATEIIDNNCCKLVPPNDASALSLALKSLVNNPAQRAIFGECGFVKALALCGTTLQLNKIFYIFSKVIGDYKK